MNGATAFRMGVCVCWLLGGFMLLSRSQTAASAEQGSQQNEMVWTEFGGQQYAFADDGEAIWIGATSSVLRWDKVSGETSRYGVAHGLRHSEVFAVAVDAQGNRWFGGDAGVSRVDDAGNWTHFSAENSDLAAGDVIAIAAGADGSLWFLHASDDGAVTHLLPDLSMHWYPNRAAAITGAYEQVKETLNRNRLWTAAGDEVWIDYLVYDGSAWHNRQPPQTVMPVLGMDVDSSGVVWALAQRENYGDVVHAWDGEAWTEYPASTGDITATWFNSLAVDANDTVWLGATKWEIPPNQRYLAHFGPLLGQPNMGGEAVTLDTAPPLVALMATDEGIWALGHNWLYVPQTGLQIIEDEPLYSKVLQALVTADDDLFLFSRSSWNTLQSTFQTLDDGGSTEYGDDMWHKLETPQSLNEVTAVETAPDGDVWVAGYLWYDRFGNVARNPIRFHEGVAIEYDLPAKVLDPYIDHVFAQSARVTWFIYRDSASYTRGVLRLDDGGTPANMSDDVWSEVPALPLPHVAETLAADTEGRLLAGSSRGLWRYEAGAWQRIINELYFETFVIVADGTIFARKSPPCGMPAGCENEVRIFRPDGTREIKTLDAVVRDEYQRVLSATRRNELWTVGASGNVWYLRHPDYAWEPVVVVRYDGAQATAYTLPFIVEEYQRAEHLPHPLAVTAEDHLFLTLDDRLLRLSPESRVRLNNQVWMLSPGGARRQVVSAQRIGGYALPLTLELSGLPAGVTADFERNPVTASEAAWLTLTADASVAPGVYSATLRATMDRQTVTARVRLIVAPQVRDTYGPWWQR